MRYWSAFYAGTGEDSSWWSTRPGIFDNSSGPETYEDVVKADRSAWVLLLVDASTEDLKAMGNCVALEEPRTGISRRAVDNHLVVSPARFNRSIRAFSPPNTNYQAAIDSFNRRCEESNNRTTIIQQGDVYGDKPCATCTNRLDHAVGDCDFPYKNCMAVVLEHLGMELPPRDLFIPAINCCPRQDFTPRSSDEADLTLSPGNPDNWYEDKLSRKRVRSACATKMFKCHVCKECALGVEPHIKDKGQARYYGCMSNNGLHPAVCGGPFFLSDFAEPSTAVKENLPYLGIRLTKEDYKVLYEEGAVRHSGHVPKWRVQPNLNVGYWNESKDVFYVRQLKEAKYLPVEITVVGEQLRQFISNKRLYQALTTKQWGGTVAARRKNKKYSMFERLVTKLAQSDVTSVHTPAQWYNWTWTSFAGGVSVDFDSSGEITSFSTLYAKRSYSPEFTYTTDRHGSASNGGVQGLMSDYYYPLTADLRHINRSKELYAALFDADKQPNLKEAVKKSVADMAEAGRADKKVPDVRELLRCYS